VGNAGAIGAGESAMPVLAIVALGRARWVWDIERGDGKVSGGLRWASAGQRTTTSLRVLSLLLSS
jgi:hypothetical protein